jgi:alkaline phosphatase
MPGYEPFLLCDFHVHTRWSDGRLSLREVIDLYGETGKFDVIAITDHILMKKDLLARIGRVATLGRRNFGLRQETFDAYLDDIRTEASRALRKYGLLVIPGAEVTQNSLRGKQNSHIIALDIKRYISADQPALDVLREIRRQDALSIACHPHHRTTRRIEVSTCYLWDHRKELSDLVDVWEAANRDDLFSVTSLKHYPYVANSDFHKPKHLYSWKTLLRCDKTWPHQASAAQQRRHRVDALPQRRLERVLTSESLHMRVTIIAAALCVCQSALPASAETRIRIMPPDGGVLAAGQRVDVRVEATGEGTEPPRGLTVVINGRDVTSRNILAAGAGGERGAGGTGTDGSVPAVHRASAAPPNTTNYLMRDFAVAVSGPLVPLIIEARTADGARASVRLRVERWQARGAARSARNVILLVGDGMGIAHRTAARLVSRGLHNGKANGRLAMDTLDVTGMVMTPSLNAAITDSSPGMAAYATGQKLNNNQEGVFPDNTADAFDNPRIEYIGELLRRTLGRGFNVGIVTTADVTDSTPAANAAHTSDRYAGSRIADRFFDERDVNGVSVLLGGGARYFMPKDGGGERTDGRRLAEEFERAGYTRIATASDVARLSAAAPPERILGLFHQAHLPVAFDKVGAGRYSDELARTANAAYRDTPMLEDLTRLALRSLSAHSPSGFYLMVEGASIDKRAHAVDAERTIWDVIEFDRAVQVALDFAGRTNADRDPANDTLVIVTADHETGGLGIIGVGNERFAPDVLGKAVRDYAAVFRFVPEQELNFVPNYQPDERGFPVDPDPSRKLLLGWAAGPDHYENWVSNRLLLEAAVTEGKPAVSVANPARDGAADDSDNRTTRGAAIPGLLVRGTIENGETPCPSPAKCPADTASLGHTIAGHTASDVPLSASGPGAWQFSGVYENSDVFLKMLRTLRGSYVQPAAAPPAVRANRGTGRRP